MLRDSVAFQLASRVVSSRTGVGGSPVLITAPHTCHTGARVMPRSPASPWACQLPRCERWRQGVEGGPGALLHGGRHPPSASPRPGILESGLGSAVISLSQAQPPFPVSTPWRDSGLGNAGSGQGKGLSLLRSTGKCGGACPATRGTVHRGRCTVWRFEGF